MRISSLFYTLLKDKNISLYKKKKFGYFGNNTFLKKPYYQLSGEKYIYIGNNVTILKSCRLAVYGENIKKSCSIIIGDGCYIGFNFTALADARGKIIIGNNVLFASNIIITNEDHGINPEIEDSYMEQELSYKDVQIDDECWIGEKVCILPGVHIGKKSIIGAGSVVTKSIPDYSIAVGNPARVIKKYNFTKHCWEKINEKK